MRIYMTKIDRGTRWEPDMEIIGIWSSFDKALLQRNRAIVEEPWIDSWIDSMILDSDIFSLRAELTEEGDVIEHEGEA